MLFFSPHFFIKLIWFKKVTIIANNNCLSNNWLKHETWNNRLETKIITLFQFFWVNKSFPNNNLQFYQLFKTFCDVTKFLVFFKNKLFNFLTLVDKTVSLMFHKTLEIFMSALIFWPNTLKIDLIELMIGNNIRNVKIVHVGIILLH